MVTHSDRNVESFKIKRFSAAADRDLEGLFILDQSVTLLRCHARLACDCFTEFRDVFHR